MLVTDNSSGLSLKYYYTSIISSKPKQVTKIELKRGSTILQTYNYAYNTTTAMLEQVTFPDASTITYAYGENGAPATALTSKKENGVVYSTWTYDVDKRANMSSLGNNGAEELNITYTANSTTHLVESAQVQNAADHTKTLYFKSIGGVNKLVQQEGDAMGSCAPSDSYTTYDENSSSATYRQKETVTEGVDLLSSNEGVLTRYKHDDANWPHLVTTKITGLKWASSAVKPWSTSGALNPDAYEIQPESQKVVTSWHPDMALPVSVQYSGHATGSWVAHQTVTFTYDDGTNNCDGDAAFNSYRVCTRTVTDNVTAGSPSRTWVYAYTLDSSTKALLTAQLDQRDGATVLGRTLYIYHSAAGANKGLLASIQRGYNGTGYSQTTAYSNYNAFGLPETITDPNNIVSALTYDARGRVNTITTNGSAVTDVDYYPNGLLQKLTRPDGSHLQYFYNSAHHLIGVKNNHGEYIQYTPSILDGEWTEQKVCTAGDETNGCTGDIIAHYKREFDALGRLSKIKDAGGTVKQILGYDTNNNIATIIQKGDGEDTLTVHDKNDLATVREYDALDRLIRSVGAFDCGGACSLNTYNNFSGTVPANPETEYAYNGQGLVSSVTDAEGHVTSFAYNGFGELTQETSPDRGITTYQYDAAGNLIQKIKGYSTADAQTIAYSWDSLNRLTGVDFSGTAQDITYIYDSGSNCGSSVGRLCRVVRGASATDSAAHVTDYSYNALGRITMEKVYPAGTNGISMVTSYAYNPAGELTGITYSSPTGSAGRTVSIPKTNGRITSISSDWNSVSQTLANNIDYAAFGGALGYDMPMNTADTLRYQRNLDVNGRLDNWQLINVGNDTHTMDYQYDAFDNISYIDGTGSFAYDAQQRLKSAWGAYGYMEYNYDNVGNRTQVKKKSYVSNGSGAGYSLVDKWVETYQYATGSNRLDLVQRYAGGTATGTPYKTRTFEYDERGNVVQDERSKVEGGNTTTQTLDLNYGPADRLDNVDVQ